MTQTETTTELSEDSMNSLLQNLKRLDGLMNKIAQSGDNSESRGFRSNLDPRKGGILHAGIHATVFFLISSPGVENILGREICKKVGELINQRGGGKYNAEQLGEIDKFRLNLKKHLPSSSPVMGPQQTFAGATISGMSKDQPAQ